MVASKKTELQARRAQKDRQIVYLYEGQNKAGLIRLSATHERLLVRGVVSREFPSKKTAPETKQKVMLGAIHRTPDFVNDPAKDHSFKARSVYDEALRVVGRVAKVLPAAASDPLPPAQKINPAAPVQAPVEVKRATPAAIRTTPKTSKAKYTVNEREIARVVHLRSRGEDPMVQMAYAAHHVNESAQNLYKKIAKGTFPPGTIRGGRARFWLISELDAYMAGRWTPVNQVAQPTRKAQEPSPH